MTRPHYHVNTFQPGCLNDCEDGPYATKRDACAFASWVASDYRAQGYRVRRTERGRYEVTHGDYGSGFIVKVEDCTEDCADYADD